LPEIAAELDGHEWISGAMRHEGGDGNCWQYRAHVDLDVALLDLDHHLRGAGAALELREEPGGLGGVGDVLDVDPPIGTASAPLPCQQVDKGVGPLRRSADWIPGGLNTFRKRAVEHK